MLKNVINERVSCGRYVGEELDLGRTNILPDDRVKILRKKFSFLNGDSYLVKFNGLILDLPVDEVAAEYAGMQLCEMIDKPVIGSNMVNIKIPESNDENTYVLKEIKVKFVKELFLRSFYLAITEEDELYFCLVLARQRPEHFEGLLVYVGVSDCDKIPAIGDDIYISELMFLERGETVNPFGYNDEVRHITDIFAVKEMERGLYMISGKEFDEISNEDKTVTSFVFFPYAR